MADMVLDSGETAGNETVSSSFIKPRFQWEANVYNLDGLDLISSASTGPSGNGKQGTSPHPPSISPSPTCDFWDSFWGELAIC